MKKISICILILTAFACNKNPKKEPIVHTTPKIIDAEYIAGKTRYFSVENKAVQGEGRAWLEKMFEESQFVVFGERHNSKETSKLIEALIPIMHTSGFETLCLEIGPNSAVKLTELMAPAQNTVENLRSFNTKYYHETLDDVPIPFFAGVEDALFLKAAAQNNMQIWGLDQEYFYAILFLTDELLKQAQGANNFSEIQNSKQKADSTILKWLIKENASDEDIDIFAEILQEPTVDTFFNYFRGSDTPGGEIVKDLEVSWDIYSRWRQDSHVDRISYMRNNFKDRYHSYIEENGTLPKVFLKFGQLHTSRTFSNGAYDLGHLTASIAKEKGLVSTSINCWTRYYQENGEEIDYLEKYYNHYKRLKLFMEVAKQDQWTLIDLRSIREDILNNKVRLPENGDFHKMNALIQGYDIQLILPLDSYITPNMEIEN